MCDNSTLGWCFHQSQTLTGTVKTPTKGQIKPITMKTPLYIIIMMIVFFPKNGNSQTVCCPSLQKIKTFPNSPSIFDSVKIIVDAVTPNLGGRIGVSYNRTVDTFNIQGCYFDGVATQPLEIIDTLNVGKLPVGTYIVNFTGYLSNRNDSCVRTISKYISDTFKVSETNGINYLPENKFTISPNPATTSLYITTTEKNYQVEIYDLTGRTYPTTLSKDQIDISTLTAGIYLLRLKTEKGSIIKKFVKE